MSSYSKIKAKATLYKMPCNDNKSPVYRVIPSMPMKKAWGTVKRMLAIHPGAKK